ncbi:hypothetical protein E3E36_00395 [Thermococcus sp. M36]|uniref:immunoglobulin-like domain-containing protein n=1 Tax=Thermococcus sp. M36 TaxID=1638261 RepID=UPI00143C8108|nr:immunoglobulin-like domain-containing protein [Thermococcus sp. M36]NJE04632.1 hypothetical protein [Thermococcus sp. M36]
MMWKTGAALVLLTLLIWGLTGPHFYVELDRETYHPGEKPVLTIRNTGLTPIYFGQGYLLYRWENGTWVRVTQGLLFIAVLHELMPFHSWSQTITLKYLPENESVGDQRFYPDLPPGRYRLVKEICGRPGGCTNASVEFQVPP